MEKTGRELREGTAIRVIEDEDGKLGKITDMWGKVIF